MKRNLIYVVFTLTCILSYPGRGMWAEASELGSYEAQPSSEQVLKRVPASNPESLGIPIFPNSKEITGDSLEQGSFQARSFIFLVPADFKKVLNFYKDRLGKTANLDLLEAPAGKQRGHFFLVAGSESRNVVVEEVSKAETRVTLTVFAGGGGTL